MLTTNLISYWKLDEASGNAADSVGTNTLTNNGTAAYGTGKINNCVDFGTANTTKSLSIASNLGITAWNGAYTLSTWVKLNTEITTGLYEFVNLQPGGASGNWGVNGIEYQYNAGVPQIEFYRYHNGPESYQPINYPITMGISAWHHIVGTYDGTTMNLYVDGVNRGSITSNTGGGSTSYSSAGLQLGSYVGGGGYGSHKQDEVGIWSRALTSTEVTQLYNGGAGLQYPFVTSNASFLLFM